MRRQLRMFGLFFCVISVLCASYAEGHMLYSDESDVTDFNDDGETDFVDFVMFAAAFGSQQIQFDLNQNGLVDFPDFLVFISAFGQPGSGSSGGTQGDAPVSAQAFQHFADRLNIQWDDDFLYIESDAFPDHRMMVGITAWNQQVPLPQPYQGDNAWQIPLKPAVADVPVYASQTLFRGAIGLAINGVPIFNPIKQNGRTDTYLAGELDEFGGHAGRADDYHYHIAPLFLTEKVGDAVPIAYALDGYPMYGLNEPDGTPAKDLDDLNGHFDANGNYHYHSTLDYPYVNGGFKGVIELFRGEEVANQPRTRPVRPSGRGMRANITDFVKGTDDWYRLTYEANGGTYAIAYFLRPDGDYDFQFTDASGNITRQTYRSNGSVAVEGDAGTSGQSGGSNDSGPQTVTDPPDTDSDSLFIASELLGRPTDRSVTVNLVPSADLEIYLEYGTESGVYTNQTSVVMGSRDTPIEIAMEGLLSDTRYYYRTRYRRAGETEFKRRGEYTFHTYRPPGTTFTFSIQACAHLDGRSSLELYHRSLENVAAYQSDFLIDLGDTFMCNKHSEPLTATVRPAPDYATVERRYLYERGNFGKITHSIPLFLVNGNHDGEEGWSLNGTPNNVAVWATLARKKYYTNPVPDVFYSGDSDEEPFVGVRESYYSWSWGDALFVVIDPYWYTATKPKRGGVSDNWRWTLGAKQYQWLRQVLEASDATFKFIFSHQLVGGIHTGEGRGGIEMAPYYEWGGKNRDDSWGFDTKRAGWYKPIHQLMVENNVSAFFHGHDHVFVKQELDGVVYQVLPQPSNTNYRNGDKIAVEGGYLSGTVLGNSGHLRVTVSPDDVVVEYIRAYLPGDEAAGRTNGEVSYSYRIEKR